VTGDGHNPTLKFERRPFMKMTISVPNAEYERLKETGYLQKTTVEQVVLQKIISPGRALAPRKRLSPAEKAKQGMFMSLRELAIVVGFGHRHMCDIAKKPEFPLFESKVRYPDFLKWYRKRLQTENSACANFSSDGSPLAGDQSDVPLRSNGRGAPNAPRGRLPVTVAVQRRIGNS
jgi:hypothetical protein